MSIGKHRFRRSIERIDKKKSDREQLISGVLGVTINGNRVVEVPGRPGYVYVRLRYNLSELVQAYNDSVSPVYDLPVVLRQNIIGERRYTIAGRDISGYLDWGDTPYVGRHGEQHSFSPYQQGVDPVWVFGRQIMPAAVAPSGTSGVGSVLIHPYLYYDTANHIWHHYGATGTGNILAYKPTGSTANVVLVWLDSNGNPQLTPGDYLLSASGTYEYQIAPYIPALPDESGIPLAAVVLTSGTSEVTWNEIHDVRQWVHKAAGGGGASSFLGLSDTPSSYSGQAGKAVKVNAGETALEFGDAGVTSFLGLSDTPSSYSGQAGKVVKVNSGESAVEFGSLSIGAFQNADGAMVSRSSFSVPKNTTTVISWTTEIIDQNNYWSAGDPTKFVIPETGWYVIYGRVFWEVFSGGSRLLIILVNGTEIAHTQDVTTTFGGYVRSEHCIVRYLNKDDYVEFAAYQDSSATRTPQSANAAISRIIAGHGNLGDLGDVVITSPADNHLLVYNGASGTWTNQTPADAGLDDRYVNVSGDTMTGDLNFNKFKAVAMVCDSGTTLPSSPVIGQWFLHTPTGRKVLMQYNGSSWSPIMSLGSYTVYVDPSGTDSQDKGYGTGANAYQTIQYAINQLPGMLEQGATINVAAGTYTITSAITIKGKYIMGNYDITVAGTLSSLWSGTATGGTNGSGSVQSTITASASWTSNAYKGKLVYINGIYRVILSNTSDTLTLVGNLGFSPTGYAFTIYDWSSVISPSGSNAIDAQTYQDVVFDGLKINTGISHACQAQRFANLTLRKCFLNIDGFSSTSFDRGNLKIDICYGYVRYGPFAARSGSLQVLKSFIEYNSSGASSFGVRSDQTGIVQVSEGTVISGFYWGVYMAWNGIATFFSADADGYPRIINNTYGLYAAYGGGGRETATNVYSGNTINEYADSVTYGMID